MRQQQLNILFYNRENSYYWVIYSLVTTMYAFFLLCRQMTAGADGSLFFTGGKTASHRPHPRFLT